MLARSILSKRPLQRLCSTKALPNPEQFKAQMERLNHRDHQDELRHLQETLKRWRPLSSHQYYLDTTTDTNLLSEINFAKSIYRPPLEAFQRITLRNRFMPFFERATTEEEKAFIYAIFDYYKLAE